MFAAPLTRWISRTYLREGQLTAAEDCLEASLALAEAGNNRSAVAHALNLQGAVAYQRRDLDRALARYEDARRFAEQEGDQKLVALTEHNLGLVAHLRGELETAIPALPRESGSLSATRVR